VGGSPKADYYLRNQGEVLQFLQQIAGIPSLRERHGPGAGKGKED